MPLTIDVITFECTDADPGQRPELSCGGAHQLALQNGSLRLEIDRELFFQDNGQIRAFDDNHRLVFDRANSLLELHEAGDIRFLTGDPTPAEQMRIRADGNVGIGTNTPGSRLHVAGDTTVEGSLSVTGATHLGGNTQVQGNVQVSGFVNANDIRKNGAPLRVSQWDDIRGGISFTGGNVAIGTREPRTQFHVHGRIASGRDFQSAGAITFFPPDGFAWFHIDNGPAGGRPIGRLRISHGNSPGDREIISILQNHNVGIGTPSPEVRLHIVGNRIRLTKANNAAHFVDLRADGGALDLESRGADLFINNHGQTNTRIRNLVQISSQELKANVSPLAHEEAVDLLEGFRPVTYHYRDDETRQIHIGFIAEEVPQVIATTDQKGFRPTDLLAVLTAVVQEQQQLITQLRRQVAALASTLH